MESLAKAAIPHRKKRDKKLEAERKEQKTTSFRAFTVSSGTAMQRAARLERSTEHHRFRAPLPLGAAPLGAAPPIVIVVQGPPGSGKSTLIRSLVKKWTRTTVKGALDGPLTVVASKARRITLVECGSDVHSMVDLAKIADLCLLTINAKKGFEMETFEFLSILQVHGFPKVTGVLTHLDDSPDNKAVRKLKKRIKARFRVEVDEGAKLFSCSRVHRGKYPKPEVSSLARFLVSVKVKPIVWRASHPYVLVDRFEVEGRGGGSGGMGLVPGAHAEAENGSDDVTLVVFGWVRGTSLRAGTRGHLLGAGDFTLEEVGSVPDPCPPPEGKQRALLLKETLLYAPMIPSVGSLVFDRDAVYVSLGGKADKPDADNEAVQMLRELQSSGGGGSRGGVGWRRGRGRGCGRG